MDEKESEPDALASLANTSPSDELVQENAARSRHTLLFWQLMGFGAVVLALATALVFTSVLAASNADLRNQLRAQTENAETLHDQLTKLKANPKVSQSEIDQAAQAAASGIKGAKGDTGGTGDTGPQGPAGQNATDQQVSDAVTEYCAEHGGCIGPNGSDATPSMVAVAVAAYCAANGGCQGPAGPAGANGADGATGPAGADGADGAAGAPGANGADGQPPVSWTYMQGLRQHTCTRTDPFDATAPTYTCN